MPIYVLQNENKDISPCPQSTGLFIKEYTIALLVVKYNPNNALLRSNPVVNGKIGKSLFDILPSPRTIVD